jgi:hypothetical protein
VTAVESPRPTDRRCPRCGSGLRPEQEWCLSCGSAVRTRVATTPAWRLPLALVAGLATLIAVALALVIFQALDDADPAAIPAAAQPSPEPTPTPPPASAATPPAAALATWPEGTTAWTIIVASPQDRGAAEERARAVIAAGQPAGVVEGTAFAPLRRGSWAVFSGQYERRADALQALEALGPTAEGAFVRRLRPR